DSRLVGTPPRAPSLSAWRSQSFRGISCQEQICPMPHGSLDHICRLSCLLAVTVSVASSASHLTMRLSQRMLGVPPWLGVMQRSSRLTSGRVAPKRGGPGFRQGLIRAIASFGPPRPHSLRKGPVLCGRATKLIRYCPSKPFRLACAATGHGTPSGLGVRSAYAAVVLGGRYRFARS